MAQTIFFSWQSDVPNPVGRSFIEKALENAIGRVQADLSVEEPDRDTDLQIDKDRKGVPGMPPIVDVIFSKIDNATAVVVDVTFAGRGPNGDPIPNPNVMIEYGWALKSLGYSRVIGVMNKAYGDPNIEQLPFYMRHLGRPIVYDLPADASAEEIGAAKKVLSSAFAGHLRDILNLGGSDAKVPVVPFTPQPSATTPGRFRLTSQALGRNDVIPGRQTWDVTMLPGSVNWLRLLPAEAQGRNWTNEALSLAALGPARDQLFRILGATNYQGSGFFRAADGWGVYPPGDDASVTGMISFIFRTGEIWGIDQVMPAAQPDWILLDRAMWNRTLDNYREILRRLGVKGALTWMVGMEDTDNRVLAPDNVIRVALHRRSVAPRIMMQGVFKDDQTAAQALEPFYREVFQACDVVYTG